MFDIFHKCGLISEFIFYSPKNVPNQSSKREDAQDSDMGHCGLRRSENHSEVKPTLKVFMMLLIMAQSCTR